MDIKKVIRNADGLVEGENYIVNPQGRIDWRKMVKPEFLVPNKQIFEAENKPVPTSIDGLEDKELLILLAGIEELAWLRGYTDISYVVTSPAVDAVFATCSILWTPNFETEGRAMLTSAVGDANPFNTTGIGKKYLGPIAENRAFVRCVRKFLKIRILGKDEVSMTNTEEGEVNTTPSASPYSQVQELMKQKNVTFDMVKAKLVSMGLEEAKDYTAITDIPKIRLFDLTVALKNKKA